MGKMVLVKHLTTALQTDGEYIEGVRRLTSTLQTDGKMAWLSKV